MTRDATNKTHSPLAIRILIAAIALALPGCAVPEGDPNLEAQNAAPTEVAEAELGGRNPSAAVEVAYRFTEVNGVTVFYREAGRRNAPTIVLLHGFPTSSHMFRELIPRLADRYHIIAPDYPGFGQSAMPDRTAFPYTFDRLAGVVDNLLTQIGVDRYALYMMDYGGPIGFRLAAAHPERVTALIVQDANAYEDGLGAFWEPFRAYWANPSSANRDALRGFLTLDVTKLQYTFGVADLTRVSPDNWTHDQALLDRPGNAEIQLDLFFDYRNNVALYPTFHRYFRERQPPTLVVWGKNDPIFPPAGATAFLRDLPNAQVHILDTGHFALEDKGVEISNLTRRFLSRLRTWRNTSTR